MSARTIVEKWESFELNVIHPEAPPIQRQLMKEAFYAGFASAIGVLTEIADADLSEDAGVAILSGLQDECLLYVKGDRS